MITYVVGDLFSSAKVLVNTVNTVGVMGKGIARDFKRIYPEMFRIPDTIARTRHVRRLGKLWLYKTPHKWILNFPTKKHWRNKSKDRIHRSWACRSLPIRMMPKASVSISFPMLGCGNGELDWNMKCSR